MYRQATAHAHIAKAIRRGLDLFGIDFDIWRYPFAYRMTMARAFLYRHNTLFFLIININVQLHYESSEGEDTQTKTLRR